MIGALTFLGDEHVVGRRIIDHARDELAVALQGERDGEDRNPVQEVRGAVERIDVPDVALVGAFDDAALFHDEAIAGPRARQLLEEHVLRAPVGRRDEVAGAFDRDLQVLDLAQVPFQAAAGLDRRRGHHIHQRGADHRISRNVIAALTCPAGSPRVKSQRRRMAGRDHLQARPERAAVPYPAEPAQGSKST